MPTENYPSKGADNNQYQFATDFAASAYWAYAKLAWGPDGSAYLASTSTPIPVVVAGASTLAEQLTQTTHLASVASNTDSVKTNTTGLIAVLTTIDADTGAISTASASLATTVKTTNVAPSGTDNGQAGLFIRANTLADLGATNGNWVPARVNQRGAQWVAIDTVSDAVNDSIALDGRSGLGDDTYHNVSLTVKSQIKGAAGTFYGYYFANKHATNWMYVKLYDQVSASVTVGTTTVKRTFALPPASAGHVDMTRGIKCATGMTVAATTEQADNGTTAAAANDVIFEVNYR
jgi:hypothetical protein